MWNSQLRTGQQQTVKLNVAKPRSVYIHGSRKKNGKFHLRGQHFKFTCLPFGLNTSSFIFSTVLTPVVGTSQKKFYIHHFDFIYLLLCIIVLFDNCQENVNKTVRFKLNLIKPLILIKWFYIIGRPRNSNVCEHFIYYICNILLSFSLDYIHLT